MSDYFGIEHSESYVFDYLVNQKHIDYWYYSSLSDDNKMSLFNHLCYGF